MSHASESATKPDDAHVERERKSSRDEREARREQVDGRRRENREEENADGREAEVEARGRREVATVVESAAVPFVPLVSEAPVGFDLDQRTDVSQRYLALHAG